MHQVSSVLQGLLFVALLAGVLVFGCTSQQVITGAFTQVNRLDKELWRGVSTKMDVRRVLGTPDGFGSAALPPNAESREVWYYEDIEAKDVKKEADYFSVNIRQQVLLVFFDKEVFDGFMWFSNVGAVEGQQ